MPMPGAQTEESKYSQHYAVATLERWLFQGLALSIKAPKRVRAAGKPQIKDVLFSYNP